MWPTPCDGTGAQRGNPGPPQIGGPFGPFLAEAALNACKTDGKRFAYCEHPYLLIEHQLMVPEDEHRISLDGMANTHSYITRCQPGLKLVA